MRLVSPNPSASTSLFADWLELLALERVDRGAGGGDLTTILRRQFDERQPRRRSGQFETETLDEEILERGREILATSVFGEISRRATTLSSAYPFDISVRTGESAAPVIRLHSADLLSPTGGLFCVFCLLVSAYRNGMLILDEEEERDPAFTEHRIGLVFQICACLAVGGYLRGDVVSFGFPRATGDGFLPALRRAWARFGAYRVRSTAPAAAPAKLKDGGIDIIAWLNFADDDAAKLLLFGQAASGDWRGKPVGWFVDLLGNWFDGPAFKHSFPAVLMPFCGRGEGEQDDKQEPAGMFVYYERAFGLIFDRHRIASCAQVATTLDPSLKQRIDGHDRVDEIVAWVQYALSSLRGRRRIR